MKVLHCDNHLLAVFKPAGVLTQGGLDLEAKAWIKEKYKKPGNVFLEPIHRLDQPVSGIVLFARTSKALSRLQEQMRQREITRIYHALVDTPPKDKEGTLRHFLVHGDFRAEISNDIGKEAILTYRLIGKNRLECRLHTGRYHQIRAQLAAIGCPIVGDQKYGSARPYKGEGIGLCHVRMELTHPVTHEPLVFETEALF